MIRHLWSNVVLAWYRLLAEIEAPGVAEATRTPRRPPVVARDAAPRRWPAQSTLERWLSKPGARFASTTGPLAAVVRECMLASDVLRITNVAEGKLSREREHARSAARVQW